MGDYLELHWIFQFMSKWEEKNFTSVRIVATNAAVFGMTYGTVAGPSTQLQKIQWSVT